MFLFLPLLIVGQNQITLPSGPGPLDNPMKGFAPYSQTGTTLNCSCPMAFEETGWDLLEPQEGVFAFDQWEKEWDASLAKGKDIVIRVYLDYPSQPSSVPKWLVAQGVGMTKYDEFGGGLSPDYENPLIRKHLARFIQALGARYDHDPRISYVQVGLLGHWGEWHDYPHDNLFASPAVQTETLKALRNSFPNKPLMARNASYASCQKPWLGFHDDMIPSDTLGSDDWEFLPAIIKGGVGENWKTQPTGGEMVPGAASQYLGKDWDTLVTAVKEAHFTWIGPYCPAMLPNPTDEEKSKIETLIRLLGYQFQLKTAEFPTSVSSGANLSLKISGVNQGVAPIYGVWKPTFVLISPDNQIAGTLPAASNPGSWLPGSFEVDSTGSVNAAPGKYRLGFGLVAPGSKVGRVKFANDLDVANGFAVIGTITVTKA